MNPTPAKRTVRVDVDALLRWNQAIHPTKAEALRNAARVEFDYCAGVSGKPPKGHEWMARIWCCDEGFGLEVPMRVFSFEDNHA